MPTRVRLVFSTLQLCHLVYLAPATLTVTLRQLALSLRRRLDTPLVPACLTRVAFIFFFSSLFFIIPLKLSAIVPRATRARDGTVLSRVHFPLFRLRFATTLQHTYLSSR